MILAELTPQVPWNTTGTFTLGLIGVLAVIALVLNVALASKKLFGKHPPIHEELHAIRLEFTQALANQEREHKISVKGAYKKIEEEAAARADEFRTLALERERNLKTIRDDFEAIRTAQAVMATNIEYIKQRVGGRRS